MTLTFFLPAGSRAESACRAVRSCLSEDVPFNVSVIVLYQENQQEVSNRIQAEFSHDPRVRLIRNHHDTSFPDPSVLLSKAHLFSDYVSFMFDGSVLSPHWKRMVQVCLNQNKKFMLGYGISESESEYSFKSVTYTHQPSEEIIKAYFGVKNYLEFQGLPNSPICCVLQQGVLNEWQSEMIEFCKCSTYRTFFLLKHRSGSCLSILLFGLSNQLNEFTPLAHSLVAQFTSPEVAAQVSNLSVQSRLGHWMAKRWFFEHLSRKGQRDLQFKIFAGLILSGFKLLGLLPFSLESMKWTPSLLAEIVSLIKRNPRFCFSLPGLLSFWETLWQKGSSYSKPSIPT